MATNLSSRLEVPRTRIKDKNNDMTDDLALSTDLIHSLDEYNAQEQG